ncbi:tetratricopeptide repeat protein [Candidatus Cyanaurora vandensis]|uniref:tetratricopeptide repeat protein n=1 Tax=Candidatus Cyanaurora vandensis TaxID=2714958 RepID=UPI0025801815|nr:tetratricopeptide repeat protein [Candidatus Cyanaurora vandensis]
MATVESQERFQQGLKLYEAEAPLPEVIPIFKDIVKNEPKNCAAWTCLSWLYLLNDQPKLALDAARKAVPLGQADAQARINLVLAMLETKQKGVREPMEQAIQIVTLDQDQAEQVAHNITDGLERRPDWSALLKVQAWLNEGA